MATCLYTLICPSSQYIIPHAAKHSLKLLRMGKKLLDTCSADWNNNKFLLLHLVGLLHYYMYEVKLPRVLSK